MNARPVAMTVLLLLSSAAGCDPAASLSESATITVASTDLRATRRAYDGAPPVIPHPPLGAACTQCHDAAGREAPPLGFAPANPHLGTKFAAATVHCRQCHVFADTAEQFVVNHFQGVSQQMRRGDRLYAGAPPVIPHSLLMRENCLACHAGPAARPEIRCSHPERAHCVQCHMPRVTNASAVWPAQSAGDDRPTADSSE